MKILRIYFEETNSWLVFILITALFFLSTFLLNEIVITDSLYYNSLGEQLTFERINKLLDLQSQLQWIQYAGIPFVILMKSFIVGLCLNAGLLLTSYKVPFKELFKISLKSELVFAIAASLNVGVFILFFEASTLEDLQQLNFLSVLSLLGTANVETWLIYPLSIINVYEFIYLVFLAFGVMIFAKSDFGSSCKLVTSSYGSALMLWLLLVVFIQINA